MMKRPFLLATAALLVACAAPPQDQAADEAKADDVKLVCVKEAPTGNRIPKTVCRYEDAVERRRGTDRETAERIQTEPHDVLKGR